MEVIKEVLLDFFEDEVKEVRVVIEKAKEVPHDCRLTNECRTILELVNHIAQIPRIDVDIYSGKLPSGEDAHKLELKLNKKNIDDVLKVFDVSCKYLRKYFEKLTDEDFLKENIFIPCDMKKTGLYSMNNPLNNIAYGYGRVNYDGFNKTTRPCPLARGDGDLFSTISDLYRLGINIHNKTLLSSESLEARPIEERRTLVGHPPTPISYEQGVLHQGAAG